MILYFILVNTIFCLCFTFVYSSLCFWNSGCTYKNFANKTPYSSVRGDIRDSIIRVKDCEPISIWAMYRNGKRNPNSFDARRMEKAIEFRHYLEESEAKGNSSLCAQDVENLKNWPIDGKVFTGLNELSNEGYQEMSGIGQRLKNVFPNLLSNLKENEYIFRPTSDDKIEDSAKAFLKGIGNNVLKVQKVQLNDIMNSYDTCEKYQTEVKTNSKADEEVAKYQRSTEYLVTKDRMQRRTGLEIVLSDENITALYDLCRSTWSEIDSKPSPWCALFTSEDLQVLEYLADLKHYYRTGYGTPMNQIFGHIPMADLLKVFEKAKQGNGKKITAYFSDETALDMTFTALGLFRDDKHLTGEKRIKNRKWRSSKLSSFSANLMAVLSKCKKNGAEDYNVVFYLNEEPLKTICAEAICPWNEFEDKMKPFLDTKIDFCKVGGILKLIK